MAQDIIARALAAKGGGGQPIDAYTKAETDTLLSKKENTIPTYTLAEYEAIKDTIPPGTKFIITDDRNPFEEEVENARTGADGIVYDDLKERLDTEYERLSEMELFKFPNATIIGSPTINNGQISGFSAENYMKFPFIVNMQGRPFTIDIAFTTGTDITNQQNIIDGIDHGIAFAIRSSKFVLVLGSTSGNWDISQGEKISSVTVTPETTYRVKISWDGTVYKFEYSTDGETYTEDTAMRVTSSLSLYPTQINIGVTAGLLGAFKGIINMNYCSLTISNKVVWTGMDDVGLATRMAIDMSNIDEAGIEKVKSIIGDVPTKEYIDESINSINERISALEKYHEQIVGVSADFQNNTYTRLEQAVGLTAGADFDKFAVYHLKRCNVLDDGTVTAYYGDPDFKEDGSNGQVMVEIPKVYYKMTPTKLDTNKVGYHIRSANYCVSNMESQGFKLHPAFIRPDGTERDFVYVGSYDGSLYDVSESVYLLNDEQVADFTADKLSSIADARPVSGLTQNLTRMNANKLATNRGAGWNCETIQIASLIQLLFIIEYAGFNTQTLLGDGVVNIPDNSSYNYASYTGSTSSLGNASGKASSTKGYDGTNYTTANQVAVSYRGIENIWGNIWKFITGVNIYGNGSQNGGVPYICNNTTFTEDTTDGYTSAGFSVAAFEGYISAFGYGNEDYDWLFIGSELSGDSTKPVGDYTYITSDLKGYRIARLGGSWSSGSYAGGFFWYLYSSSSNRSRSIGARLCFNP